MIDYPDEGAVSSEIDDSNSTEKMQTEDDESSGDIDIEQQEKNDVDLQNNTNKDDNQELSVAVDKKTEDDDATATTVAPNDDESSVNKSNIMADQDEKVQQQTTIEESRTSHQSRGFLPLRTSFRNKDQDEFVKNGARVKAVFTSTFRVVANGLSSTKGDSNGDNYNVGDNNSSGSNGKRKISKTDFVHAQDLAQEKTEECMALKRVSNTYYCLILFLLKGGDSYHILIPT